MTLKRLFWIIAGGLIGALFFIGIVLVLMILISSYGPALPYFEIGNTIEKYKQTWTLEKVYKTLIAGGIIGFFIGIIACRKHSRTVQKWFSPAVGIGIPAILFGWFLYVYASHVEVPQILKLADCSNRTTKIHLKIPNGHYYRLVIIPPSGATNIFSGNINISDGIMATNISIGSNLMEQQCNFFHAQSNYDIEIVFNQSPPPSTSIELRWLQTKIDRTK